MGEAPSPAAYSSYRAGIFVPDHWSDRPTAEPAVRRHQVRPRSGLPGLRPRRSSAHLLPVPATSDLCLAQQRVERPEGDVGQLAAVPRPDADPRPPTRRPKQAQIRRRPAAVTREEDPHLGAERRFSLGSERIADATPCCGLLRLPDRRLDLQPRGRVSGRAVLVREVDHVEAQGHGRLARPMGLPRDSGGMSFVERIS